MRINTSWEEHHLKWNWREKEEGEGEREEKGGGDYIYPQTHKT